METSKISYGLDLEVTLLFCLYTIYYSSQSYLMLEGTTHIQEYPEARTTGGYPSFLTDEKNEIHRSRVCQKSHCCTISAFALLSFLCIVITHNFFYVLKTPSDVYLGGH